MNIWNTTSRKTLLALVLLNIFLLVAASVASAWEAPKIEKPKNFSKYPERPIDFICGWGVGGGADIMTRKLAQLAQKYYGVDFVVTNMPGAAGVKGIDYAMRQPRDGYTVFFAAWDAYMNYLLKKMEWKPEQINLIVRAMNCPGAFFVRGNSPFKTWNDVIEHSKKEPYKLKLAAVGRGGLDDLTLTMWQQKTGLKLTYVPFDNPSQRYAAFSGGHTDLLYEQPGDIAALLERGARPLVFMSEKRIPQFPDVPIAREIGHDITIALWRGVAVPSDFPPELKEYLTQVFCAVVKSPEYKEFLKSLLTDPEDVLCGDAANKMFMDEYRLVDTMMKGQAK